MKIAFLFLALKSLPQLGLGIVSVELIQILLTNLSSNSNIFFERKKEKIFQEQKLACFYSWHI